MIRVVTLDEFDAKLLEQLCKTLYAAFGVGSEHAGSMRAPAGMTEPFDGEKLLSTINAVRAFRDDKLLYLTSRKLKDRALPTGAAPTQGCASYGKERVLVSTHGMKNDETLLKTVGRLALHQLGHLWELHHCLDPRCAMYPPWTPSSLQGEATFCTFCRDKSEHKIRLEKS